MTVADDGPGVSEEERQRMFDRFVRLGDSAPNTRGSGLGLTISRSIVRLHRGRIWADPARKLHGLAIIIELPRVGPKHDLAKRKSARKQTAVS